jgi:type IV pilus assembly protein PilY1
MSVAQGGQLTLSTAPPPSTGTEPHPNVIVTVDDSGSMSDSVSGSGGTSKMTALKAALLGTFGDTTLIPDGRIRLAWQSMHDNGNFISNSGASTIKLGAKNSMKLFSGTTSGSHRQNFTQFVNGLSPGSFTPSIDMFQNVFTYLNAPENPQSPWADDPTVSTAQTTPYLACRRTFHVFMTDGVWNKQAGQTKPGCTNGGKVTGNTTPPTCSNAVAKCPSNKWSLKNNMCTRSGFTSVSPTYSANTSVYQGDNPDRVTNGDGVTQTLPDGTVYDPSSTQVRAYRDTYGDDPSYPSTLSDLAFSNWASDLQDGDVGTTQVNSAGSTVSGNTQQMENIVFPAIRKKVAETVTDATGASTALTQYWNPKNDPATWQHVTQYMIGFGTEATTWNNAHPFWGTNATDGTYDGEYPKIVNGSLLWPDVKVSSQSTNETIRAVELWHGALNGRGKFIPANTNDALAQAFKDILTEVLSDTSKPLVTVTTSSSTLRTNTFAFIAGYKAGTWSGQFMARPLDATDATILPEVTWDATTRLDDPTYSVTNRFVLSYGQPQTASSASGFSWKTYSSLPTTQQTPLNKNSSGTVDSNGQNRVDYIRGDRSKELAQTNGIFRDRDSRLGDIVNSNVWYTGRPASGYTANGYAAFRGTGTGGKGGRTPTIYVGANDGMLHGVAAATNGSVAGGTELLAYIPQGIAEGKLRDLTDPNYLHEYFVDGTPFTGDAYITTPASSTKGWTTVLVGTLGAGGKGYFILDATDPANFTVGNAANLVIADTTGGTVDSDIGVITSPPVVDDAIASKSRQIVEMNNGRWAVVLGNGYNSSNEAPVLVIQYLDGDKSTVKISPCASPIATTACSFKGTNGLSNPQLIDLNGDGRVDVAYAGDLKGNLWKFNLSSATQSNWTTSFSGQPFFVAKGPTTLTAGQTGVRPAATVQQAITTAPYWMPHPQGGIMVSVGTGRNLTDADRTSTAIDTYYALWDKSSFTLTGNTVTLTEGSVINTTSSTALPTTTGGLVQQTITGTVTANGSVYYSSSNNPVDYSTNRGWYIDLSLAGGERVLINTRLFSGETILMTSTVPKVNTSSMAETCKEVPNIDANYLYFLNMFTGNQPKIPVVDTGTDNVNILAEGGGDTAVIGSKDGDEKFVLKSNCLATQTCPADPLHISKVPGRRVNWRQK